MVALVLDGLVGFPAGLSPTSFHLSPSSFHLSPKLGACGRVPGWLVSHFLHLSPTSCHLSPKLGACGSHFLSFVSHFFSFVSQFFSFVSQAGCLWSGSRLACLHFLYFFSFVFQFFSFVSHAGCLWSGSRLACLPLPFICLPVLFICLPSWVLVVGFPAGLSPTSFHLCPTSFHLSPSSFHLSPRLGACGRVPGWLVSHFLSFVSHFFSFVRAGRLWSSLRLACLPRPFIFLSISPNSLLLGVLNALKNGRLGAGWSGRVPGRLVSHFLSFVSQSPRLGACGRVPGRLVSHFLFFSFVSHFFSFVSQAGCLWSRLACLPPSFHSRCLWSGSRPLPFICLPGWVLVVGFPAGLSPTSFHLSPTSFLLVVGFPAGLSPTSSYVCRKTSFHLSPTSFHLSPRLGACSRVSGRLVVTPNFFHEQFAVKMCPPFVSLLVSAICWCPPFSAAHVAFLFVRLPGRSLLVSALFRWPCNISIHLSTFLFICLPGLSLAVSALFR